MTIRQRSSIHSRPPCSGSRIFEPCLTAVLSGIASVELAPTRYESLLGVGGVEGGDVVRGRRQRGGQGGSEGRDRRSGEEEAEGDAQARGEPGADGRGPAISDVRAAGMTVLDVAGGDLVPIEAIATRAKVTVHAVRHWIAGVRGPGGFPEPVRAKLFSWAQVSDWLVRNKLGEVDHVAREVARAAVFFNALLTADRIVDDIIPAHRRADLAKMSGKLTYRLTPCG